MLTYTYFCTDCDKEYEILQNITDTCLSQCKTCLSTNFKKVIKVSNFQLKGSFPGKEIRSNSLARSL